MKYLHCYLLKTEVVNLQGESEGDIPQFLLQVDEYNENKHLEETKFLYLDDNIECLKTKILKTLQDNSIIRRGEECVININNSDLIIEFDGEYFITTA